MLNKRLILSGLFILTITLSNFVSAASIVNGTFNSDLSGWSTVTNGGTVQWDVSGKAVLLTGSDAAIFSSALVQGDDGFFSFSDPIVLGSGDDSFKFDFDFSTLVADALETATSLFNDNLKVWLYDADSLGDVLITSIDALTSDSSSFSFNLLPYLGHSVAFSFELNDENDGVNSQVALDNIRIEQTAVPLSGTLGLEAIGLLGLAGILLRNKRFVQPSSAIF